MASPLLQNEVAANLHTNVDCRISGTLQYVFKLDIPPQTKFAKATFAHEGIFFEYVGLWMTLLGKHERISNRPVTFYSTEKKEGELAEQSCSDVFLSAGDNGIKEGVVLTLEYNRLDETCLVTLRAGDDVIAKANANEESRIMSFHVWCQPRGMGTRDLVIQGDKQPAVRKPKDEEDIYLDPDLPEHNDESGGVLIGDVKTLYEQFAELKLKGRL